MLNFIDLGNGLINVVLLLAILVALVVIHEFGHFVVARRAGVRVHEFGIGFPPRAATSYTDKKGTAYTLNWLPIGGFVRLEGEEGESDDPHAFVNQRLPTTASDPARRRRHELPAGLRHLQLASHSRRPGRRTCASRSVEAGGPAASVGLLGGQPTGTTDAQGNPTYDNSGDVITAIDGQRFPVFDHIDQATPRSTT